MNDRLNLVAHLREQIAQDPARYANLAKLEIVAERIQSDLDGGTE